MALPAATRLGPYEVVSSLGEGGMGVVYRARDTRLHRDVALKVLPDAFAGDPNRLARFDREAQLLAALNHPHIAQIYGIEEAPGIRALIMELVPGEPLSTRIARGPVPLDEALAIPRQLADALDAAHDRGIVHRDLKPANVMLTPDGQVKVLDFGLAKLADSMAERAMSEGGHDTVGPAISISPTVTSAVLMTNVGMLLGTAAYMAPEQAKGRVVDKRADIWAFGVILYEMVTGKRLFAADSVAETIAAILTITPDWSQVPQRLHAVLQATLERDPRRRLRDIGDAFRFLDPVSPAVGARPRGRMALLLGMGVVTLSASAFGISGWTREVPRQVPAPLRLQIALPPGAQPDLGMSLSPDGHRVAFIVVSAGGARSAWVRDLDDFEARPVRGADDLDTNPLFWSADSRWLGFAERGVVFKADIVAAGNPVRVTNGSEIGADWNDEGTIVFGTNPGGDGDGSIFRVSASGGNPVRLTSVDAARGEYAHHHPVFLPDGRHFLYLRAARPEDRSGIYVGSIDATPDQQPTQLVLAAAYGPAFFAASGDNGGNGYLFFLRENALMAQPFDATRLALSGQPVEVAAPVGSFLDRAMFWVSRNRTIVSTTAASVLSTQLTWVDRRGQVLRTVGEPGPYTNVVRSPNGTQAALIHRDYASGSLNNELWLWDLEHGTRSLLWFKSPVAGKPVWSPEGNRLFFASDTDGGRKLYERAVNGAEDARVVVDGTEAQGLAPTSWSPDGRFVLFVKQGPKTGTDIWALSVRDRTAAPVIQTAAPERDAQFSPDGRWIAYTATEAGRAEVYVTAVLTSSPRLTVGGGPWRVSIGGGRLPRWRADGREIFYVGQTSMMAAQVLTESGFAVGPPSAVAVAASDPSALTVGFGFVDASPDGRQFLFAKPVADPRARAPLNVLLNWRPDLSP